VQYWMLCLGRPSPRIDNIFNGETARMLVGGGHGLGIRTTNDLFDDTNYLRS
jgi:hypothetical protein